jgi:hypothetical protein
MERLIPFKIIVKTTEEEMNNWIIKNQHPVMGEHTWDIQLDAVFGKDWTVVGLDMRCFLLVRPGEIAQWWPRELCQVLEVPAI